MNNTATVLNVKLSELRSLMQDRFPQAHGERASAPASLDTGVPCWDALKIPGGSVVEVVGDSAGGGTGLLLHGLLAGTWACRRPVALVDGRDSFDPDTASALSCAHVLWVRCREVSLALRAVDLLLRDGNLPLILLDLQMHLPAEVRRLPNSTWFRLRALTEKSGVMFVAFTPCSVVPCAWGRFRLSQPFGLEDLDGSRGELVKRLRLVRDGAGVQGVPSWMGHGGSDGLARAG